MGVISIKDTVGRIHTHCPKCKSIHFVEQWGEQTCIFNRCDGHKFNVEYNSDWANVMLKQIEFQNVALREIPNPPLKRPSKPKLQKTTDCWILVPQPDSTNPEDWYANDPFKV